MASQQLLSTTSKMIQVTGGNRAKGTSHLPKNLNRPTNPHIANLLNTIASISSLAENVHCQILNYDASTSSRAEKYERAYVSECNKFQRACEANNGLGRENEVLRRENAKYKDLESRSQRLNADLLACEARYRELDELNGQVEKKNQELGDINAEMEETIEGFRDQIIYLEARLQEVDPQPYCVDKGERMAAANTSETGVADKNGSVLVPSGSSGTGTEEVQPQERRQPSRKRKRSVLEEELGSEQEQRNVRRRK